MLLQHSYTYGERLGWLGLLGYLMGCGNPKSSARQFDVVDGIVQGHAYAILDVREVAFFIPTTHHIIITCGLCSLLAKVEGVKLIKLRNPWGESAWAGGNGSFLLTS
jgi:hypothetical protein